MEQPEAKKAYRFAGPRRFDEIRLEGHSLRHAMLFWINTWFECAPCSRNLSGMGCVHRAALVKSRWFSSNVTTKATIEANKNKSRAVAL